MFAPEGRWTAHARRPNQSPERKRRVRLTRPRAGELAHNLEWVSVRQAEPTPRDVGVEEHIGQAVVFIALRNADEQNIIAPVLAKTFGVTMVIAVAHSSTYVDLGYHIGVDRVFSPSRVAAKEIQRMLDEGPLRKLETLADGVVDAYQVRVRIEGEAVGRKLKEIKLSPNWIVTAIRRGDRAWVPGADDALEVGDTALLVGRHGTEQQLKRLFIGDRAG